MRQLKLSMDIMRRKNWKGPRVQVHFRVSREEYEQLVSAAGKAGKNLSEYIIGKTLRKR